MPGKCNMPLVYRIETPTEERDATLNTALDTTLGHTQSRWIRKSEYSLASALPASGRQS